VAGWRSLTWFSAAAAIISAVYAGCTYNVAERGLAQQREALLVAQRIETCAELERRARSLNSAISNAALTYEMFGQGNDFYAARNQVLRLTVEFADEAVLGYLGPPSLAEAESALQLRLGQASGELDKDQISREAVTVATEAAFQERLRFSRACRDAVSDYQAAN
jgi:hypothetical protein